MRKTAIMYLLCAVAIAGFSGSLAAQSQPALASSATGFDYFVRMAVHFGDVSSIPGNIVCCRSLAAGETVINVPIWVYNLHEGVDYIEFSIQSNENLGAFIPGNSFGVASSSLSSAAGSYRLDLVLQACGGVCGPARIGNVEVIRVTGSDPVWIVLGANAATGRMVARDASGRVHEVFSPQNGGYVGSEYLYTCRAPASVEPNTAATGFELASALDCRVRLRWRAGGGNRTMLRWSMERFPMGLEDGILATELATNPGQAYDIYHGNVPTLGIIYYTAFSITRDASGAIVQDSFAECAAIGYTFMRCPVANEESSWGTIKSLYR